MVNPNVPGNGVEPWKYWFAWPVGVPHSMNAKPGFLQQIICIYMTRRLHGKKPMKLWADTFDESCSRGEIALLVAGHQHLQIAIRMHEMDSRRAISVSDSLL